MKTPASHKARQQQTLIAAILTLLIYGYQAPWYAYLTQTQLSSYESRRFVRLVKDGRFAPSKRQGLLKPKISNNEALFLSTNNLSLPQYQTTDTLQSRRRLSRIALNITPVDVNINHKAQKTDDTVSQSLTINRSSQAYYP